VLFQCELCKRTSDKPPPDAPENFDDLWPEENRVLPYSLQVNHKNKDFTDNDPSNLQWLCALCHKVIDGMTEAGEVDYSEYGSSGIS